MSKRLDLPDGGWAEIKEPREVTNRQKREHTNAMIGLAVKDNKSAATLIAALDEGESLTVLFIKEWSYDTPVSVDSYMDLPVDVCQAIEEQTLPAIEAVFPELAERRKAAAEARGDAAGMADADRAIARNSFDADGALDPRSPTAASPS